MLNCLCDVALIALDDVAKTVTDSASMASTVLFADDKRRMITGNAPCSITAEIPSQSPPLVMLNSPLHPCSHGQSIVRGLTHLNQERDRGCNGGQRWPVGA
jgi:hypothetical protein